MVKVATLVLMYPVMVSLYIAISVLCVMLSTWGGYICMANACTHRTAQNSGGAAKTEDPPLEIFIDMIRIHACRILA